jgi:hypothetical protein
VKVSAIIESVNYDTLTVDELFSKLKSTEIDYQTQAKIKNPFALTIALVLGNGLSSSANPSQMSFVLSSLVSITEKQLEALEDDELALVISQFSWFYNNYLNTGMVGIQRKDVTAVETPTTSSPIAPRRTRASLASMTLARVRISTSTPPASTS